MSITKDELEQALAANNDVLRAELASKVDLEAAKNELRAGLASKADLEALRASSKADLEVAKNELRAEIQTSEARVHAHVDHASQHWANVVIESFREQFARSMTS